jgi:hypothetical protein
MSSKEAYNNVEVSEEELSAIDGEIKGTTESKTPKEEPSEVSEAKEVTNPEGSEGEQEYQIEVDGKTFSIDDVVSWKKDSDNRSEWSKSNTEKAQKIAGVGKFLKKFNEDAKFQEHLKDYFDDEKDFNSLNLIDNDVVEVEESFEEQVSMNPLEERLDKLEEAEDNRIIDQRTDNLSEELSTLENDYPEILGTPEQVMDFLQFSESNSARYRDNKGVVNLSNMFKEYSFDHMREELSHYKKLDDNKHRNSKSVINRSEIGATETVTQKSYDSWKDIDPHSEDLKKYFD